MGRDVDPDGARILLTLRIARRGDAGHVLAAVQLVQHRSARVGQAGLRRRSLEGELLRVESGDPRRPGALERRIRIRARSSTKADQAHRRPCDRRIERLLHQWQRLHRRAFDQLDESDVVLQSDEAEPGMDDGARDLQPLAAG